MATRYPEVSAVSPTRAPLHVLERALQQLTLQVADQKRKLADTFRHIHQIVSEKEETLVAQLDAIPGVISAKIEERRTSLEQLTRNKEDTERQLQANCLNEFLQKQLSDLQIEMDKIISEQILFPCVSVRCDEDAILTQLKDFCPIHTTQPVPNRYGMV